MTRTVASGMALLTAASAGNANAQAFAATDLWLEKMWTGFRVIRSKSAIEDFTIDANGIYWTVMATSYTSAHRLTAVGN